jgi:hypothetical protein
MVNEMVTDNTVMDCDDVVFIQANKGTGKLFPGGPAYKVGDIWMIVVCFQGGLDYQVLF